jgi:ribonucleotide monophosphatase NagD (HAD superfamily)
VDILAGKPSKVMMEVALDRLGVEPEECIMVGDRIETDIRMGKDAGMYTAVVLTGVTTYKQVENTKSKPDFILSTIDALFSILIDKGLL